MWARAIGFLCVVSCGIAITTSAAGATDTPHARLRNFECRPAVEPAQRELSVDAVMKPVPGTVKLALKFELESRTSRSAPFRLVKAGDLGKWISPTDPSTLGQRPGDVWVVSHPVVGLTAPAVYRFKVSFRWAGTDGKVLATAVLVTRSCRQPELRPDLLVKSVTVQPVPGKPDRSQYTAVIANAGVTAAGPFEVTLSGGGTTLATRTVTLLRGHTRKALIYGGPACSSSAPLTVTVDPSHLVSDDLNPANNAAQVVC